MLIARSYSHHSLLSAVPKINFLVEKSKEKGYSTIALTDEETGSGLIEFIDNCKKVDINPSPGTTLKIANVADTSTQFGRSSGFCKVALLAKNNQGYKNLLELISLARVEQEKPVYHITLENLKKYAENGDLNFFVVLAGNDHELIASIKQGNIDQARGVLRKYVQDLGAKNLLVELAYKLNEEGVEETKKTNLILAEICDGFGVKYIASPAPRYIDSSDEEVFRVLLAVRDGKKLDSINLQRNFYLPSLDELKAEYSYLPNACDTQKIEEQIQVEVRYDYDSNADEAFFPDLKIPENQNYAGKLTWDTYINFLHKFHPEQKTRNQWREQFPYSQVEELKSFAQDFEPNTQILKQYKPDYFTKQVTIKEYFQRIGYELEIIIQKGYPSYFLVFADIMGFCRDNNIVASTRGSAAGSLVGYLIDINILDPMVYKIPFERFLNPLRPSAPDIDGDFADDRREEVIKYITQKYGQDKVTQIITFGTILPRVAVRDVGRALGVAYKKCDKLAKLIPVPPQGKKATFEWAMETSQELAKVYENDADAKRIIDISKKVQGNYRHASSHAAGVIVSPTKMSDYAPLQWDSEHNMVVVQYDMKISEKVGLVKLDILGIRNLAILGNAIKLTKQRRNTNIDLHNIDVYDQKAFDLLSKGRTMGLFQLAGGGMTKWLLELAPTKVQDIMAMVALYRPGPMANIPEYIKRKRDSNLIHYYQPQMEEWMGESYGIFVYQDDLLYTIINLAGYNWLDADKFRKGMGKKIKEVIVEQHVKFVEGCKKYSAMSEEEAEEIWAVMEPFAAYGFNKAHASSYGMVAYWTTFMKAEYTVEFMTALMTAESNNLDKIALSIKECEQMNLEVKPPDVNKSHHEFTIESDMVIRYGLSSVKNLGKDVINFMIQSRQKEGDFKSIEDFLQRMSAFKGFNKRSLDALIWAGCLDKLGQQALATI